MKTMLKVTLVSALGLVAWGSFAADDLDVGIPQERGLQVIRHEGYALGYAADWKIASWVQYRLTEEHLHHPAVARNDDFREDPAVRKGRSTLEDYRGSGYDRGHLAPAADMKWSPAAMSDCFYLSNMTPQTHPFNAGVWERLESACRTIAYKEKSVVIVTGPVMDRYDGKTIGPGKVAVPPAFYKVIYDETPPRKMIGFIIKHKDSPGSLVSFACTVDEVERRTGLDFFSKVSGADQMEATCRIEDWTLPGKEYNLPGGRRTVGRDDATEAARNAGGGHGVTALPSLGPANAAEGWILNLRNGKRHKASCPNGQKAKNTRKCGKDEGVPAGCCGG